MNPPYGKRLAELYRRLEKAPRPENGQERFDQLAAILNAVEDEMTDIPYDPANWMNDGRMYPPQADSARSHPVEGVTRYRTKGHNVLIGTNGAIEIRTLRGEVQFAEAGADGKRI